MNEPVRDQDIDRLIREALGAEDAELYDRLGEGPIHEMVGATFRGMSKWLVVLAFVMTAVFVGLAVVSAVQFFRVESTRAMIGWSTGFLYCIVVIAMLKIWYWMELNKTAMTREIKRVELQLASLVSRCSDERSD